MLTQVPKGKKTISAVSQHQNSTMKKHLMHETKAAIVLTLTSNEMQPKRAKKYTILNNGSLRTTMALMPLLLNQGIKLPTTMTTQIPITMFPVNVNMMGCQSRI